MNLTIVFLIIVYAIVGVITAATIYNSDNANMKNLGDAFQYKVVRATILIYAVVFGPVVIITFTIMYLLILIAGLIVKLAYMPFDKSAKRKVNYKSNNITSHK